MSNHNRITSENKRKTNKKINNALLVILLITMAVSIAAFGYNIVKIQKAEDDTAEVIETTDDKLKNEYSNALYEIGNNPTDINKEYFKELNDAVESNDSNAICSAVVKCFISEYYTWTNKDGNYDVGGMQYIFTPKQSEFASYSRYNFYEDMDLYLTQIGRDNLMTVKDVQISAVYDAGDMEVQTSTAEANSDTETAIETTVLPSILVEASWSYEENASIDVSQFQSYGRFRLVNNNGRWEIASISSSNE